MDFSLSKLDSQLGPQLEKIFHDIQTKRMDGVPVINETLQAKAIGFKVWNNYYLGILITPWFMNLMLIPAASQIEGEDSEDDVSKEHLKTGSTKQHIFPSGAYEFVAGFEEEIGHYQSCSLFSPMFEFENQQAAEKTAREALKAIMDEENIDNSSQNPAEEIQQIWSGEKPEPLKTHNFDGSEIVKKQPKPKKKLSERLKEPSSRRDFLRGKAFRDEPTNDSQQG